MEMDGSRIIVRTYHMFSLSLNFLFVIVFFQEKKTVILALWNLGTVKSRVEARVTSQKIKSLGVLQTETCH